jgi:hypothetical protein
MEEPRLQDKRRAVRAQYLNSNYYYQEDKHAKSDTRIFSKRSDSRIRRGELGLSLAQEEGGE